MEPMEPWLEMLLLDHPSRLLFTKTPSESVLFSKKKPMAGAMAADVHSGDKNNNYYNYNNMGPRRLPQPNTAAAAVAWPFQP
ncbi:hypothetical protein QJS10_CPB15g00621 [Acorus calamus]|uniref:Uncharacterized protein n=1 Tax=Acorus calamus TaxID=4465 RepID=A0AAV9D8G6_ACOCL|nr:hypothetical protein QJS10_CPB15g00621 [Acorus calamus]